MKLFLLVVLVALAVPAIAAAQPAPVAWCGADEAAANRVPDLEVSAAEQVRFLYAVPQDGEDRFLSFASGIATDAAWIEEWWTAQDPTRTPRFDRYPFANCTTRFGQLDIGFARLAAPGLNYAGPDDPSLGLDLELGGAFGVSQKTIVYYDGPIRDDRLCGETDFLANTRGGRQGIVYVYLQSGCELGPHGTGGTAEVAAHELLHNLGAVTSDAPHECKDENRSHACDSTDDILDPFIRPGSNLDKVFLDVGRDDYYAHSGPWWDIQDSAWLSHLPQQPFSLAVTGSGTVVARAGGGVQLPCDSGCTGIPLDDGTTVSVIAEPAPGWKLASWGGGCGDPRAECTLTVSGETAATAAFVRAPLRVTAAVTGKGTVKSAPAGIACPGACKATFSGLRVRLTAKPAPGWRFTGWSGACTGKAACSLSRAGTVRAKFARR